MDALADYRNRGKALPSSISLPNATEEERRCYMRLLRLKHTPDGPILRCNLKRMVDVLFQQDVEADWHLLLDALCGPVPEGLRIQEANQRAWSDFWPFAEQLVAQQPFQLATKWLQSLRADGSLLRLSKGDAQIAAQRLKKACDFLAQLPLSDEPLPGAAARICGDAHALDSDSPLSTLILRSLSLQRSIPMPDRSDDRRLLWEHFGIICDDLSAPVLTLNLGITGQSWLCRLVAEATKATQPLHVTNRMIATAEWSIIDSPSDVFVFENPTIISLAAAKFGHGCPPIVCVNGEPRSTSRALLRRLRERGSTLWYHGDFDWAGIGIAARVISELGAKPWLFDDSSYRHAINLGFCRNLSGRAGETPWCPELGDSMRTHGLAVDEEAISELLFHSLAPYVDRT